jgi:O-methyltransferase domain/Dimerisation domain
MSHSGTLDAAVPVHAQLIQMSTAYWVSRAVYAAAALSLADHLTGTAKTADELAGPTGTHAPSLYRLMRALAGLGILTEDESHRFALTALGEAMKTGAPGSARSTILTLAGDWCVRAFLELPYSLQTGKSGFEKAEGKPLFEFIASQPDLAAQFSDTMVGFHGSEPPAIAAAYDFSAAGTIVDVGGASGNLLATILARHPSARGILFDLPHVVTDAPPLFAARGVADRVAIQSGSFFDGVPSGGDIYTMSHVIHDWSEEQCLTILEHCRQAMHPDARLLVIEMVLPEGNEMHPGKMLDLMMLVGPGGQERTAREYGALLAKAGFRMTRIVPTASAVSLVEAVIA